MQTTSPHPQTQPGVPTTGPEQPPGTPADEPEFAERHDDPEQAEELERQQDA